VLPQKEGHLDPAYLVRLIREQRVTVVHFVPSLLQLFLDEPGVEECISLRQVMSGGEAMTIGLQAKFFERLDAQLVNCYGPTETSVNATFWPCRREQAGSVVPIGRPISGAKVYVLDGRMQPVPVGVPGELYIGGAGLARGYWNRPDLTAERFVQNPFAPEADERLYRTGDLVRWMSDGTLAYLGRTDDQVKVRGLRIELGEIEAAVTRYPGVREVTVLVREDVPGDKRIVAYLTADSPAPTPAELRRFVKEKLPEYMVPSAFVVLEALPMTPNGKVDRAALPAPEPANPDLHVAPRTLTEKRVAEIFAEVLHTERVGIHDHFFERGGHSLLATQAASRIGRAFGVEVPVRSLFEHPTVAEIAVLIEQWKQTARTSLPVIEPAARTEALPLSFAQQRLWLVERLAPDTAVYNMPLAMRLQGPLQTAALEASLNEILRRHEALRTTFDERDGELVQVIAEPIWRQLPIVDLSSLSIEEREEEMQRLVLEDVNRAFDLQAGPLIRFALVRLGEEEHVLLLNMHHIVSDGWSIGILTTELSALYQAFVNGQPSPLEELPIQYADYAHWQRRWLQGDVLEEQLAYWRRQLGGELPLLELPTDHPRPAVQTHRGATHAFALSSELTQRLKDLSQQQGVTLFMTLLGAYQVLLSRYSGQEDILVGTPVAGRNLPDTERLIGFFVNTLVMRSDLSGNPTFAELLARVRNTALEAYAHQDISFEKLVEELQPRRDMSRSPLFQVMFVLQNTPMSAVELEGLTCKPVEYEGQIAKFDLTLTMSEEEGVLVGAFEYSTDLFLPESISRMAGHFIQLLEGVVDDLHQPIKKLPLLTAKERHQLLEGWNGTKIEYPPAECLHHLFEEQAERTPDAVALVFRDETMTYRELNRRANGLARALRQKGVGPDVLVGICAERSFEMVVALLAVLKAGGAYVPVDPAYPTERIAFLLEDSKVRVLLTQKRLADLLPEHPTEIVLLDAQEERSSEADDENLQPPVTADHLAYVIYTSGSTGKPKGVMIPHRAICNHMRWYLRKYEVTGQDHILQRTSFSFDPSVTEFFAPLLTGGRIVLAEPGRQSDLAYLTELIAAERVTMMQVTPSLLRALLEVSDPNKLRSLRHVFCGGEVLSVELAQHFHEKLKARLHNMYGPTEACIDTTCWECEPEYRGRTIPIGRPIDNVTTYVLDEHLQPVPVGLPGELHIGGAGLARGYLNRPDLTAESFIPHPFDPAGGRLYKTGDLVRYRPDGSLEYLGRKDQQVKVRGYRIELEEVESALAKHPNVRAAVVEAREVRPGDRRLIAYVVADPSAPPKRSELGSFLKQQLPEYMVPSAFVLLDELPINANGKIDRRALPDLRAGEIEREEAFTAPRDALELELVRIWEEVLGVHPVGIHDNFFELGGHSLLAVRLIGQIEKRLGLQVPLSALFQGGTVERLAGLLREQNVGIAPTSLVRIQEGKEGKLPFFCVHAVGGNVLSYFELARALGRDQPFYGLQARGLNEGEDPLESIEEMAALYIREMRTIQPEGPYRLGGWSFGGVVAFEMAQQLRAAGQEVELLVLLDSSAPMEISPEEVKESSVQALFVSEVAEQLGLQKSDFTLPEAEMTADAVLEQLLERAETSGVLPPGVGMAELRRLYRVYRANFTASHRYVALPYEGRTVLFRAEENLTRYQYDPTARWTEIISSGFRVYDVPGDHYSLLRAPHLQRVAEQLKACLEVPGHEADGKKD
jgi:amino acid adenylation domain-containing protein